MFKKTFGGVLALGSVALAHIKPFEHEHIGFLHTEDVIMGLVALAVIVGGAFLIKKLAGERA